jgi:hypothetical protein
MSGPSRDLREPGRPGVTQQTAVLP